MIDPHLADPEDYDAIALKLWEDISIFGTCTYLVKPDGSVEHIPIEDMYLETADD